MEVTLSVTDPLFGVEIAPTDNVSPSESLSLLKTKIVVAVSSFVVALSATAVGESFIAVTVIVTVRRESVTLLPACYRLLGVKR